MIVQRRHSMSHRDIAKMPLEVGRFRYANRAGRQSPSLASRLGPVGRPSAIARDALSVTAGLFALYLVIFAYGSMA